MAERTPLIVLLSGPNGAGKSTSAARLLQPGRQSPLWTEMPGSI
jgi:pantothenate kinase-related protein Tda10